MFSAYKLHDKSILKSGTKKLSPIKSETDHTFVPTIKLMFIYDTHVYLLTQY